MKKAVCFLLLFVLLCSACGRTQVTDAPVLSAPPTIPSSETVPANRTVRISVTEMLGESEAFRQLCDRFERETAFRTECSVNTDSVTVSVAETGKMDILIARHGTDASRFVTAGNVSSSFDWLSDSLVLAGPADDPAAVSSADTAAQAMIRIAKTGSVFVSRYDDSDVSRVEMHLWNNAGVSIGNGKKWYRAVRLSMTPSLRKASEMSAYILSDSETFFRNKDDLDLQILMRDDPALQMTYGVYAVNADVFPTVNTQGAAAWIAFLQSDAVREFLGSYGTDSYGSPIYKVLN